MSMSTADTLDVLVLQGAGCGKAARPVLRGAWGAIPIPTHQEVRKTGQVPVGISGSEETGRAQKGAAPVKRMR